MRRRSSTTRGGGLRSGTASTSTGTRNGRLPPQDLASTFYPSRGAYSSRDWKVLSQHMSEIARAGVDEVVSSWWGLGSPEADRLPTLMRAAWKHGLDVAVHLEPYEKWQRTRAIVEADFEYLRGLGVGRVYVYFPFDGLIADAGSGWSSRPSFLDRALRADERRGPRRRVGFDGVYTYDVYAVRGSAFAGFCKRATKAGIACARRRSGRATTRVGRRRITACGAAGRAALRRHVARGDRGSARSRHDHELQRVARGHADRASPATGANGSTGRTRATRARTGARGGSRNGPTSSGRRTGRRRIASRRRSPTRSSRSGVPVRLSSLREDVRAAARHERGLDVVLSHAAQRRMVEDRRRPRASRRGRSRERRPRCRWRGGRPGPARRATSSPAARCRTAHAAPPEGRCGRSSPSRCRARSRARAGDRRARTRRRGRPPWSDRDRRAPRLSEEIELAVVRVRRVDDGRLGPRRPVSRAARSAAGRARRGTRRSREAARKRGREAERSGRGVAGDLDEPVARARPNGVGASPTRSPRRAAARRRPGSRRPSPGESDRGRHGRRPRRASRARSRRRAQPPPRREPRPAEIVELSDRRVARGALLAIDGFVRHAHGLWRLERCLGEHGVPPGPEVGAGRASPQSPLEAVRMGVDEARQGQRARHALILAALRENGRTPLSLSHGRPRSSRTDRAAAERAHDPAVRPRAGVRRAARERGRRAELAAAPPSSRSPRSPIRWTAGSRGGSGSSRSSGSTPTRSPIAS